MKQTLIIFILFLSFQLDAQWYQTVYSDKTVLFEDENNEVQALRIDSVKLQANDSVFYPFSNIRFIEENSGVHYYSPYKPSWVGSHIVIQPDGTNLFFNEYQDTIKIKTQAELGDSWLFYQKMHLKVIATVSNIDTLSFLGQVDSVKTISLQAYTHYQNQAIGHAINSMPLILSKEHGLLSIHNFYILKEIHQEEVEDSLEFYSIIGMDQPEIGVQNLTWFEVHDFQVGDIIHKRGENHNIYNFYQEWFLAERYLERFDYADSIVYRIERENLLFNHEPAGPPEYFLDTIYHAIYQNPEFDQLSFEPYLDGSDWMPSPWVQANKEIPSKSRVLADKYWRQSDSSWYYMSSVGTCGGVSHYYKGLGGEYIYCPVNMYSRVRELLYYQKGNEEWGEPIDFSVGIKDIQQQNTFRMMPNPAKDKLRIILDSESAYGTKPKIEILNAQGKLIQFEQIYDSTTLIDISDLEQGLYFVRIGDRIQKLLVE